MNTQHFLDCVDIISIIENIQRFPYCSFRIVRNAMENGTVLMYEYNSSSFQKHYSTPLEVFAFFVENMSRINETAKRCCAILSIEVK